MEVTQNLQFSTKLKDCDRNFIKGKCKYIGGAKFGKKM